MYEDADPWLIRRWEYARTHTLAQHCRKLLSTKGWKRMSFAEHRVAVSVLGPNLDADLKAPPPSNVVPFVWRPHNNGSHGAPSHGIVVPIKRVTNQTGDSNGTHHEGAG